MKHGTLGGYNQHRRRHIAMCPDCAVARLRYDRIRKGLPADPPPTLTDRIVDVISSYSPVTPLELTALLPTANPESLRRVTYRLLDRGLVARVDGRLVAR